MLEMNDTQNHMHPNMGGMDRNVSGGMGMNGSHHRMMMHMSFYWGANGVVLFTDWPGFNAGMYYLCLVFVFTMSVLVEWLSHCQLIKSDNSVVVGFLQTLMHAIRMGLAYMVMLAVMSFNGGVFMVAIAGHALGFLVFGSRVFNKSQMTRHQKTTSDLPPMSC